ncbi:MAG: trigger factor [Bacteroidales bacterium]|nr:trigger factor [Bacteroidales bacterium]
MNVEKQVIDSVNASIKINLVKADYQEKVEKTLKTYRQKANEPGFRPGMVPMGLIQKKYGKAVLAEEINKIVSEALYNYIKENNLNILGEPLPNEQQAPMDFNTREDFEFVFDLALAPELDFTINKKDSIPYYKIEVNDDMLEKQIKSLAGRGGNYEKVEEAQEGDTIKGVLTEIPEEGQSDSEDLVRVEEAIILPAYFKNEEEKAAMKGVHPGDKVRFNPYKATEGHEAELASMLHLPKEKAVEVKSDFEFEVKEISRFKEAELNQELFDQIYGKDQVTSEEAFRAKVREEIEAQFAPESDYRFMVDAEKQLVKKLKDVEFPVEFLKRWLLVADEKRNPETIDQDMPKIIEELKWHLMKEQIIKRNDIQVSEADVLETARKVTRAQFAQYGMASVPDDLLNNYAAEMLKKPETARNLSDQTNSAKVADYLKSAVKLNEKTITAEEFNKLYEN